MIFVMLVSLKGDAAKGKKTLMHAVFNVECVLMTSFLKNVYRLC